MDALLDTLLTRLAYASLQAIVLSAILLVACRLLPSLSAAARSTLWWLLGAQVVIGLVCPSPFALPLLPAAEPVPVAHGSPAVLSEIDIDVATSGWSLSWTAVLFGVWALAIVVQLALAAVRAYRLTGIVRRALPHDDVRVETLCARRAFELGLHRSPRLAVSREVDSPQVIGFLRPTILLPLEDRLDDDEVEMALMHELAHVRRGDLMLGCIPALARTLFFFHPLVHLAAREYALCREAACDALVISSGRQAPRTYGRLLLRLGVCPHPHHALPGASPTFRALKRRLDMLGNVTATPPRPLTWCLVAVIAAVGVVPWRVVAATDGTSEQTTHDRVPSAPPAPPALAAPAAPAAPTPPAAMATPTGHPLPMAPPAPRPPAAPVPPPAQVDAMRPPHGDAARSFIFFSDDIHVMDGNPSDFRRAQAARNGDQDLVWYRDGQQAWVLKDPAYIKRIHEAFRRNALKADDGAVDAEKLAEVDRQQAVLNEQMAKLAERQTDLSLKEADPMMPNDRAAYAAGHAAIAKEQAALGQKMGELGQVRAAQGKRQAEWGLRQAQASRQAAEEVNAIVAEAIRNKAAQSAR